MVRLEEERFGATMIVGLKKLDEVMEKDFGENNEALSELYELMGRHLQHVVWIDGQNRGESGYGAGKIPLKELAKLYDTYGTPIDLMYVILSNDKRGEIDYAKAQNWWIYDMDSNGVLVKSRIFEIPKMTEEEFKAVIEEKLKELQQTSEIGKTKQAEKINPIYADLQNLGVKSNFHGYDKTEVEDAKVLALVKNDQKVDELNEGDEGLIVLDETPFYAESGGQVGDAGKISGQWTVDSGQQENIDHRPPTTAHVFDTFAPIAGIVLHKSKIEKGSIRVGDVVTATVDVVKRDATRRNHTATHLVHAALKEVLGTHVKQAGSVVAPNYLRFDFTHYQPISEAELTEIEDLVNREILKNDPVNTDLMSIEDAMRSGAMALFGEKYGSTVRVLSVGGGDVFQRTLRRHARSRDGRHRFVQNYVGRSSSKRRAPNPRNYGH